MKEKQKMNNEEQKPKIVSQETREKLSRARKGKTLSLETRLKISATKRSKAQKRKSGDA